MAKNKIEGTEEETPKTRKEIRQERRQMRAINAGRQEMGGDKLYTKKEIRDVNKPFEAKPSDVLTGTKQGTTYNDPNAPAARPDFEYIHVSNEPGIETSPIRRVVTADNPDYDQLRSRLSAGIFASPDDPNTGEAVKKVLVNNIIEDKNTSFEEKQELTDATNVAKTEVNKIDGAIEEEAKEGEKIISTTDPNAIGGSGASVAGVMDKAPAGPEWTSVVPTGQQYQAPSREEIYEQARQAKVKAPNLVVEKLGLQDYYPEAGRNIAVGTFTGSRIGSQTIYSGAGGLLPLGLYDARKRAIATEIKKKEALVDQLKEVPNIAKQFQPYYSEDFMNFLSPWMDAFKDKPEELLRNTDFLKGLRQKQAVAENFLKVNENFKSLREKLVTDDGKPAAWANERMLKILNNFNAGMLPGEIEKYFDGTKNISDLETSMREIPNAYSQADEIVKQLMDKGAREMPINVKTGKEFTADDIKEMNSLVKQLNSPSPDYEIYAELKKKFFDFDYEDIARAWIEGHMPDLPKSERDAVIDSVSRYMFSQMPKESIISTVTKQANDFTTRRGQDMTLQNAREQRAWQSEENEIDRRNSPTFNDVENLVASDKTSETVQHAGAEVSGNGIDYYWHVRMDGGPTRAIKGSEIIELQKKGHKFIGRDGDFKVPGNVALKPSQTTYTKSGNRVMGRTRAAAFSTEIVDGEVKYTPLSTVVDMGQTEYTNSDGSYNKAKMGEKDMINYNKSPSNAAKDTEGGIRGTRKASGGTGGG